MVGTASENIKELMYSVAEPCRSVWSPIRYTFLRLFCIRPRWFTGFSLPHVNQCQLIQLSRALDLVLGTIM